MFLGVNKFNFFIYFILFLLALIFIGIAVILYYMCPSNIWYEILLSLGCSIIPTTLTAYFIDLAAEKRKQKTNKKLRKSFMGSIPFGIFNVAKVIIEKYGNDNPIENVSLKHLFEHAISNMERIEVSDEVEYIKNREDIIQKMKNSFSLFAKNCNLIIDCSYMLQINSVFSEQEIITLNNMKNDYKLILEYGVLSEMGEAIKILVNNGVDYFPEIKGIFDKEISVKNHKIIDSIMF